MTQSQAYNMAEPWQLPLYEDPYAEGWTPRRTFGVLIALGMIGGLVGGVSMLAGAVVAGVIIAGVPFAFLIMAKPEIGLFVIAIYAPFEIYGAVQGSFTITKVLGLFTAAALLGNCVIGRRKLAISNPTFILGLLFAIWTMVCILGAPVPERAVISTFTRFQMVALVFVALSTCLNERDCRTYLLALIVGAAIAGTCGFFLSPALEYEEGLQRASIGRGGNQLAKALQSGIFLLPWVISRTKNLRKLIPLGVLLILLVSLVASGSRSNYVAVLVGTLIAIMFYRGSTLSKRLFLCVGILVFLAVFLVVGSYAGMWDERLYDRLMLLTEQGLTSGGRLGLWKEAIRIGFDNPIFGVGPGNYELMVSDYGFMLPAHNDLLNHFAETGIPGLVLYLGLLVTVVASIRRIRIPILHAGVVGLFVAANVASMANPSYALKTFWLQLAACVLAGIYYGRPAQGEQTYLDGAPPNEMAQYAEPVPGPTCPPRHYRQT